MLNTALGELPLRRAEPNDAGHVFDIMCDAALWLASRGIRQWRTVPTDGFRKFLDRRVATWPVYLLEHQSKPIATICLQDSDVDVWTRPEEQQPAGYIHGLAIREAYHGKGVGRALIDFAEQQCRKAAKQFLRLDCVSENQALRHYYLDSGFREVRIHQNAWGDTRLFEKAL